MKQAKPIEIEEVIPGRSLIDLTRDEVAAVMDEKDRDTFLNNDANVDSLLKKRGRTEDDNRLLASLFTQQQHLFNKYKKEILRATYSSPIHPNKPELI